MDFTTMDARAYRGLNAEQFEERRSLVLSLAQEPPADATMERMDAIDSEITIITDEMERRNKLAEARNQKAVEVVGGAGKVVGKAADPATPQVRVKKDNSLGRRVWDQLQERSYSRGERFQLGNVAFRAATDPQADSQLGDAKTLGYYADELTMTDTRIREGYRRPLTIWDLFNHESTEKDAVAYYVEGAFEGSAGMTAELGAFKQIHVAAPERKTESLKKVTAIWKQSDEILTDAPRFVSHVNSRAAYNLDTVVEDQLVMGDGTGDNLTGITNASGILTATASAYDLAFIESLLAKKTAIRKATPNFNVDTLLVADEDYDTMQTLKNSSDQYVLGGPVGIVYGNNVTVGDVLWRTIRIVPTPALTSGTSILGAFKAGATIYEHVTGRRFDTGYDGDDFSHGRVSFRAYQRLALAVEYPAAFCKYTVG
ncbi:MAG: phage major capsid protein [Atopobiaceae bacterium]|nr:phage major capsid protein [Atopobiaceae bacterium]